MTVGWNFISTQGGGNAPFQARGWDTINRLAHRSLEPAHPQPAHYNNSAGDHNRPTVAWRGQHDGVLGTNETSPREGPYCHSIDRRNAFDRKRCPATLFALSAAATLRFENRLRPNDRAFPRKQVKRMDVELAITSFEIKE